MNWTQEQVDEHYKKLKAPLPDSLTVRMAPVIYTPKPRMNPTEAAFAQKLEIDKRFGEILWYGFEAIKLRLADKTHYTPDFAVVTASNSQLRFIEVKGFWRDDARVKIKVAAELFPFTFVAVTKVRQRDGGGWAYEYFAKRKS